MIRSVLLLISTLWVLPACTPKYGCKGYPEKAACLSAREAYEATEPLGTSEPVTPSKASSQKPSGSGSAMPTARRSEARILRIWQAPFENREGDLEGAHYTLSDMEPQHWEVEGAPLRSPPKISRNPIRPERLALRQAPKLSQSDDELEEEP